LTPDRRRELVDKAILHSKDVQPLLHQFAVLGKIADRLIDLGDVERAQALLREGEGLRKDTPELNLGALHGSLRLTEPLARLDLPAALRMAEEIEQGIRKKAARDPSRAL